MTPDKTLEELARECAMEIDRLDQTQNHGCKVALIDETFIRMAESEILDALQSATAAQQREVERLQALLKESVAQELPRLEEVQLIYKVTALEEQLRTERERVKEWRAAFHKYGRHLSDCHPHQGCNCGFTALSHSGKEGV